MSEVADLVKSEDDLVVRKRLREGGYLGLLKDGDNWIIRKFADRACLFGEVMHAKVEGPFWYALWLYNSY